jgi:hypothetical protein
MEWMSRSNMLLLAIGAYVAVMALVRLMRRRRDELVADVQRQLDARRHQRGKKRRSVDESPSRDAA